MPRIVLPILIVLGGVTLIVFARAFGEGRAYQRSYFGYPSPMVVRIVTVFWASFGIGLIGAGVLWFIRLNM